MTRLYEPNLGGILCGLCGGSGDPDSTDWHRHDCPAVGPAKGSADTCPFCAIIRGLAPARVVMEWDDALVIGPLAPVTDGHLLVLARVHAEDFGADPHVSAQVMRRAAEFTHPWARVVQYNIITSVGEAATQSVKHLHVHIVPRREGDGLCLPWTTTPTTLRQVVREELDARDARAVKAMNALEARNARREAQRAGSGRPFSEFSNALAGMGGPASEETQ